MQHYILMADVIGSRTTDQVILMKEFKFCVDYINNKYKSSLLSPLTITLGDEFQGVIKDANTAVEIIISIEEYIISKSINMKLRYVLHYGGIDTEINSEIAYEMLGEGLTEARSRLMNMKNDSYRFEVDIKNEKLNNLLSNSFIVYQDLIDGWNIKRDGELISLFIKKRDYKIVADLVAKTRSQIWKRERGLKMTSYYAIKSILINVTIF
ncbi:SatD family protein [Myroides sp.]|uniref:SatD family protein n=1 Tax=Myroides sp. TaxID=1874736 RepID=UPI003F38CD48